MIPQITEVNFPAYATLSNATASFADMGDRFISTTVKIDGDVVPSFSDWELLYRGERFVLAVKEPQAAKDNTSRMSSIDLTFFSWPILQMKRYFMFNVAVTATGSIVADKYNASVALPIADFCQLLSNVLSYYFHGKIYVDLASGITSDTAVVEMNYTKIWDVLTKLYDIYGVKWRIEYVPSTQSYAIKVGYPPIEIDDHEFEYGYEGGLLRFERQVQDGDIANILLGRGGSNNVPYRYFKATDPNNPEWAADPDYVPELANVYFDRIRDANFRSYVQGWRTNAAGVLGAVDTYDAERASTDWAYEKGHTDTDFDPVEYVKDDESILKYGERWGHLEDNDDIYPTIQGLTIDGVRVDTVIGVSPIVSDNVGESALHAADIIDIQDGLTQTDTIAANSVETKTIQGTTFTVPNGVVMNLMDNGYFVRALNAPRANQIRLSVLSDQNHITVYNKATGQAVPRNGLTAGTYYFVITIQVSSLNSTAVPDVTYGVNGLYLMVSSAESDQWRPTFDIYVCNIFQSTQGAGESNEAYAERVWGSILGDRVGNEAKIAFSDGPMSISEDYEFTIAQYPEVDRTHTLNGVQSEWKITLNKSDAEYDVSKLYIPNATSGGKPEAGNHFYFLGIDMPHLYVTEAEKKLRTYKETKLDGLSEINPTWVVALDKIRIDEPYNQSDEILRDKIDAGVLFHIKDPRFTPNSVLDLYAASVTITWNDGTVVLPDVDVTLAENVVTASSTIGSIQNDISTLRAAVSRADGSAESARGVAEAKYLGKSGDEQLSLSPTRFASIVASENFKQGDYGGEGWGFYEDNSDAYQDADGVAQSNIKPQSVLEVDRLIVRREMMLNSLTVNQVAVVGGREILSAASVTCTHVVESGGNYTCYFDQKQGAVKNLFQLNDIAMGQIFDGEWVEERYYRMLVVAVGLDYITLSGVTKHGSGTPQAGDIIVQYGNAVDEDRQYVIERDVLGGGYERMLSGLNTVSAAGEEYFFAGIKSIEGLQEEDAATPAPAPYFYIGNNNSNVKFNSRKRKVYIKGSLVISPSGAEFPVPCFRGDYDPELTYYLGDLVVYNGESWIQTGDEPVTGVTPGTGESWHRYSAKGTAVLRLDLTNESTSVNADSAGNILPSAVLPTCTATLYDGIAPASGVTYSLSTPIAAAASGVTIDSSTGVLTFANNFTFTGTTLEISVVATKGTTSMAAIMTVTKQMAGANGEPAVSYWIVLDTNAVSVDPNVNPKVATPATVTATAMMQLGANAPTAATGCTLKYAYDDEAETTITSGTALTIALTNSGTDRKTLHFYLYKNGTPLTLVDQESVPILYSGANGDAGAGIEAQYSANGTNWHTPYQNGDIWMRIRTIGDPNWGDPIRIVGEKGDPGDDGLPGPYTEFSFANSPNLTSSQSDGCPTNQGTDGSEGTKITVWVDAPPAAETGKYLWMRTINYTWNTSTSQYDANTPTYTRIDGKDGKDGKDGQDGKDGEDGQNGAPGTSVIAQYSEDGTTNWHTPFSSRDLYMRTSEDGGTTWGAAIRIVGEQGLPGTPGGDGAPGSYTDFRFANSPNLTSAQSDGCPTNQGTDGTEGSRITVWTDAPPAREEGKYLWMQKTVFTWNSSTSQYVGGTPSYTRIDGKDGTDGQDGQPGGQGPQGPQGPDGDDGYSTATLYLYKRESGGAPATAPGDTIYTFAAGTLSPATGASLNGWSTTIPTGTNPCYVTMSNVKGDGASVNIRGGFVPNGDWTVPTRLTGDNGLRGKTMRGVNEYSATYGAGIKTQTVIDYEGLDDTDTSHYFYDIVSYNNNFYYCKIASKNGTLAKAITPGTDGDVWVPATYFDFVATRVLLAQNADIDILGSNAVYMKDDSGNFVVAGLQGGSSTIDGNQTVPQVNIFAGTTQASPDPLDAPFRVDYTGKMVAENAEISGVISANGSKFTDGTRAYAIESGNGLYVKDGHTRIYGDSTYIFTEEGFEVEMNNGQPMSSSSHKSSGIRQSDDHVVITGRSGSSQSTLYVGGGDATLSRGSEVENLVSSASIKHIWTGTSAQLPTASQRRDDTLYIVI